ncbi:MAG TPA: IS701 family transposase [Streptosporangiaceae bacterium]|nr:IS701 family transposase [Streptosporangiaceae bacterium]
MRPCFARTEPWLQAGKYLSALTGGLARRNGWTIAEHAGDRAPDKTQRLLSRAVWDTAAAMGVVRRFAVAGLQQATCRGGRRGLVIGAVDETGQEKSGTATAGVQRQYLGCAGKVTNGINTVHLAYVREHAGHALIGARQWIPAAQIADPARSAAMGLPTDLEFRTKGQLAIDIIADALADGICFDFFCGDEVYGSCTQLREFLEAQGQAYVLRVPRNFRLTMPGGQRLTCADAASQLAAGRACEVRSAGAGARGQRWYGWSWLATASAQHYLLIRRHLRTGELAFHYCFVPAGQPVTLTRLIRAAGLRWPVEEQFRAGKDFLGLDESQVRLYPAIARHTVLVMAALAICAVTAAQLRDRTSTQAPPPVRPGQAPPADTGMIPLTTAEIARLLTRPAPPGAAVHWLTFRRRHQARARWHHQRTRLITADEI